MIYFRALMALLWKPLALIGGLLFVRWTGARDARLKADIKAAREYAETMERMNEVDNLPPADARKWLRKRGQQ